MGIYVTRHEVRLINRISLIIVLRDDCLFWPRTQSGAYIVKPGYNFLAYDLSMQSLEGPQT